MPSPFLRKQLLYSHNTHPDVWGGTLVSETNPVRLQDPALPAADLAKKREATASPSHCQRCRLLLSGSLKAPRRSPAFFFLVLSLALAKAAAGRAGNENGKGQ